MKHLFARQLAVMASVGCGLGCSPDVKSAFHASDPSFRPAPGTRPLVYLDDHLPDLPRRPMHSVGIIEVSLPERTGGSAAAEVARAKGDELGCWIVVEHAAFTRMQASAALDHGAQVLLVHGTGGHVHGVVVPRGGRRQTVQFDCVLKAGDALTRTTSARRSAIDSRAIGRRRGALALTASRPYSPPRT